MDRLIDIHDIVCKNGGGGGSPENVHKVCGAAACKDGEETLHRECSPSVIKGGSSTINGKSIVRYKNYISLMQGYLDYMTLLYQVQDIERKTGRGYL